MNKMTIKHMDIAHKMYCHWCTTAEPPLREKWYRTSLTFWTRNNEPMASIRWPAFDLDIASFKIPNEMPSEEDLDMYTSQQQLCLGNVESGEPPIVSIKQSPNGTEATICEIVDAFLEGTWTPFWHCTQCRKRLAGNLKPI